MLESNLIFQWHFVLKLADLNHLSFLIKGRTNEWIATKKASVAQWLACWTIVPNIVGSNPAEAFGFFMSVKKSFSMPSFRMGK